MPKKQYKKMQIVAVPLKPEQAVLSCCQQPERNGHNGATLTTPTFQCGMIMGGPYACIWNDENFAGS